jgi:uncharacterized SAM-binding protein YcdF (DUF218 family)
MKILATLALPPLSLIALAALGLLIARRHARTGHGIAWLALAVLLALSFRPVSDALLRSLERYPPISADDLRRVQAIVILAGGGNFTAPEYGGSTVNRWTLQRIRYAVFLQKRANVPLLVTGGNPAPGRPEAEIMQELIEGELQGKLQWLETTSFDTAQSAAHSGAILRAAGVTRIALVSDAWHLLRAVELFEQQGLQVCAAPPGFATRAPAYFFRVLPSASALSDSTLALHEWLGILVQRLAD